MASGKKKIALYSLSASGLVIAMLFAWIALAPCPHPLEGLSFSRLLEDRNGELLRLELTRDEKYRVRTRLEDIPPEALLAVLRYEDRFFWSHPGVNPLALGRAALDMLRGGRISGASTITMQVVRLSHKLETGSISAKLRQILLALQLEWHWSKTDILEAYFNLAPYGGNVEGLGAAALCYFHKKPAELSPDESLSLMLVPQNPARRLPRQDNPEFMAARARLSSAWHGKEELAPLRVFSTADLPFAAPHLSAELLQEPYAEAELRTTIDLGLQERLEEQLRLFAARGRPWGLDNAAALLLHWPSMEVRAMTGSADFFDPLIEGQIDGTRARRSPGSTLKPFIYALALEQGLIHPQTLLADTPRSFAGYDPENFDGRFRGPLPAAEALRASRNVPALILAARLRDPDLYEFLRRGKTEFTRDKEHYGLSLVLGGAEMTMRELAALYAALANQGIWRPLRLLQDSPGNAPGNVPGNVKDAPIRLLSAEAAFVALSMLKSPNPDYKLPSRGGAAIPLRLKTGTSNGFRDAWAVGVFGPYVLVVWAGNFDNSPNPLLIGAEVAAPLCASMARELAASESMRDLCAAPDRGVAVERIEVCAATGDLDTSLCADTTTTWFIPGVSPLKPSGIIRTILVDADTGLRACAASTGRLETKIWEFWPTDLEQMFRSAGVLKAPPPPFGPECRENGAIPGSAPVITRPKAGMIYHLNAGADAAHDNAGKLALMANADADARTLHWFADERYLGSSEPGKALLWQASPGIFTLRAVDDAGRFAIRRVELR